MSPSRTARCACCLLLAASVGGCSMLGIGDDEAGSGKTAEGPRVEVEFDGLDEALEANARAFLGLAEEPCDAPEWRIRRRFAVAEADIARGLKPLGYYEPVVGKSLASTGECWQASFTVDPGPRVEVEHVEIVIEGEAASDEAFAKVLGDLPLKPGMPLDHGQYESTKRKLASLASGRGYQRARVTRSVLRVDPAARKASALITLESGPRFKLGELDVDVEGLDEDLVRRILEYEPGKPYSADDLHTLNRRLNDSGYFANVDVRAEPERATDLTIPLTVTAELRKRHLYTAGAGYSTDTGPRVRLGYENRRINKRGHRWVTNVKASPVETDLVTEYRIPLDRPRSEWLTFSGVISHEDNDTYRTDAARLAVRSTHLRGKWLEARSLEYSRETFRIGQTRDAVTFVTPGLSYHRVHAQDGALRPRRGWRLFGEVRAGSEALLSDADVLRLRTAAGYVRELPWKGRIITRAEAGALVTSNFSKLPPSLRFFAGGDNSIRGYEFETLGPQDSSGAVIGGRYLGVVSVEYEHPIQGPWSAAVFADTGNAFDNDLDSGLKTGIGVGLRWQSPVGPIRVDLAHPLDDDDTDVRLHVRIGPDL